MIGNYSGPCSTTLQMVLSGSLLGMICYASGQLARNEVLWGHETCSNPKPLNPINPKPSNPTPKPLNPKPLNPKP